jgi:peptidyl-prolyl cis-trans isomerase C
MVDDGIDYLVFFDQQQRLDDWAGEEVPSLQLPGHVLAEMTTAELHWAMNIGTDYNKQFAPDEIAWLKEVVERCMAEEGTQQ